ncbi:MAG: type II toxin-antitoxin system prevent-host-death family antitoxin [Rubrivivax sp.]
MKTVTAAEANRQFSSVLREVSQGQRIVVTSRGKPVATIEPLRRGSTGNAAPSAARQRLLQHLSVVQAQGARDWQRDDLYE